MLAPYGLAFEPIYEYGCAGHKAGSTVTALKGKVIDKGLLYRREGLQFALVIVCGLPFYRDDGFFIEIMGREHTGATFRHRPIRAYFHNSAGMTDALPAAKTCARQIEMLVQEVDHGHIQRYIHRTDGFAIEDRKSTRLNSSHVAISY